MSQTVVAIDGTHMEINSLTGYSKIEFFNMNEGTQQAIKLS